MLGKGSLKRKKSSMFYRRVRNQEQNKNDAIHLKLTVAITGKIQITRMKRWNGSLYQLGVH